jgi:transcriptional regulator of met regulon
VLGDTTEQVRELAKTYGVSERTAWRWFAAMRAAGNTDLLKEFSTRVCGYCGSELPQDATLRLFYCDDLCRNYARRRRLARAANRAH